MIEIFDAGGDGVALGVMNWLFVKGLVIGIA